MRTRRAVIVCVIALGLLMVSSLSSAQERVGGSVLAPTPVLDSPFTGDAVTTWRPASNSTSREWRVTARYYRDGEGRVRVEQTFVGHAGGQSPQRVVVAPDPNSRRVYVLDPAARTAFRMTRWFALSTVGGSRRFVLPISMGCVISLFRPGLKVPLDEESLGHAMMDGVRVEGTRVRAMLPLALGRGDTIDERWVSPELKLEMYGRSEDAEIGVVEHRLTTISRTEPRPELFEVPADYDQTVTYPGATWLNPYSRVTWPRLSSPAKAWCGSLRPPGF